MAWFPYGPGTKMAETHTSLAPIMKLSIRPLTPNLWPALKESFSAKMAPATVAGACTGALEAPIARLRARKTRRPSAN